MEINVLGLRDTMAHLSKLYWKTSPTLPDVQQYGDLKSLKSLKKNFKTLKKTLNFKL